MSLKRVFDIVGSVLLLILLFPILVLIACLVRLVSGGPVIFKQERMGYQKRVFTIYKFRTMRNGSGTTHDTVLAGDPRVTSIGRILRSTHFDELPQLFNVLRGEMSLVGPRPETPEWYDILQLDIPDYSCRLDVVPGMTGLAQIGGRPETRHPGDLDNLSLDILYVREQSLLLDLKVLLQTVLVIFKREGI